MYAYTTGRDTIVSIVLIQQLPQNLIVKDSYVCAYVLQIRQEKPYYIADPEVDSLVSTFVYIYIYNFFIVHGDTDFSTSHK